MDPTALLINKVLFPAWVVKNASTRLSYATEFERTQFWSADAIRELQWRQFRRLLQHAFDHCVFYRRTLAAAGIEPGDIRSLDDIHRLPTVTKQEIQESLDDLIADNVATPLLKDMTGGSTGSPMVFYYDEDRLDSRNAAAIRHNRWTGWDIGDKMGVLWGSPRDLAEPPSMTARVRDWILDRCVVAFDASSIDDERMRAFHTRLHRHRPQFLLAYANTLALFARFVQREGLRPHRPRAIICSGEVLTDESRALIESTFGCRVFNRYGSREFSVIASECSHHEGMHVNAENLWVEVVTGGTPSVDTEGEIIVADLKNLAMPLIRYRTRDVGVLKPSRCACGRGLPLMDLKGGRVTDFLVAVTGEKVSGIVLATYAITGVPGIRQVQFVQSRRDCVTARVVRGSAWSDDSARTLLARIRTFLGASMTIQLAFVEDIPFEASGKYRFSISTVAAS